MTALIRKPTFVRSLCTQEYSTAELLSFTLLRDESLCMACVRTFNLFCFSILLLLLFKKKKFLWFFIVIVVIVITIRNHHCHFSLLLPVELDTSVLSASSTTVSPSRHPSLSLCPFDGVRLCFSFLCPSVSVSLALSLFVRLSPSVYVSLFFSRLFFSAPSPQPHQLN